MATADYSADVATPRRDRIARFSGAERLLHWLLAGTFFVLLGSGLALYLPSLANVIDRPTAKAWHIDSAIVLGAGTVVIIALNLRRFRRTARELDRFDHDDRRWLTGGPGRLLTGAPPPPQGRFNAGQKINTALVGAFMLVMFLTGFLLWYGERDTRFHFAGTITIHDWVTWILMFLVAGHLYLAVFNPATRHSLRGMTLGDVDRDWARHHHAKWVADEEGVPRSRQAPSKRRRRPLL